MTGLLGFFALFSFLGDFLVGLFVFFLTLDFPIWKTKAGLEQFKPFSVTY